MTNDTKGRIVSYLQINLQSSADDIHNNLGLSRQIVHRHLKALINENKISKIGTPPKVYYQLAVENQKLPVPDIPKSTYSFIEQNYLLITPTGSIKPGIEGFVEWCNKVNLPVEKTAEEYKATLEKYAAFKKNGLIDGMPKLKHTFNDVYLDKVFYLDFYSIERFGKTKLGQNLLYAKQSQNQKLINNLSDEINPSIHKLINKNNIEAAGFIPPTVKREVQFMRVFEKNLNISLPILKINKIKTEIAVPQKTLNRLADRIENAQKTMVVDDTRKFKKVLLIDDAVGSGATLNEVAKSIKEKGIAKAVIGLAITGSFKGFDVISEV